MYLHTGNETHIPQPVDQGCTKPRRQDACAIKFYTVGAWYLWVPSTGSCFISPSSPRILRWILENLSTPALDYSLHFLSYPGLCVVTTLALCLVSETQLAVHEVEPIIKCSCTFDCVVKWKLWNGKDRPDFHWPVHGQGDVRMALQFRDRLAPCYSIQHETARHCNSVILVYLTARNGALLRKLKVRCELWGVPSGGIMDSRRAESSSEYLFVYLRNS